MNVQHPPAMQSAFGWCLHRYINLMVEFNSHRYRGIAGRSNVQRRTSNNDVAPLRNLISFVLPFLLLFSPSTPLRAVSLLKIPSLSRWPNGHFDTRHRYRTSFASLLQDATLASSSFFSFNIRFLNVFNSYYLIISNF
jgi:hypothetical protein